MIDARKWERHQAVEEVLRRFGAEASMLAPGPSRPTPAALTGWDSTSFSTHRELLESLITACRVIRGEGFTPDDAYARRGRAETRAWHHLQEGYTIHELLALVAHELAAAITSRRGAADSALFAWLTAMEWGASVYGAPAELEFAAVDHDLACRVPLSKAALVKRLVWAVPFLPDDRRVLEETTVAAIRALAARYRDTVEALRRAGSERAEELALYADNLDEAAAHFW
jgi:hypothetical protein